MWRAELLSDKLYRQVTTRQQTQRLKTDAAMQEQEKEEEVKMGSEKDTMEPHETKTVKMWKKKSYCFRLPTDEQAKEIMKTREAWPLIKLHNIDQPPIYWSELRNDNITKALAENKLKFTTNEWIDLGFSINVEENNFVVSKGFLTKSYFQPILKQVNFLEYFNFENDEENEEALNLFKEYLDQLWKSDGYGELQYSQRRYVVKESISRNTDFRFLHKIDSPELYIYEFQLPEPTKCKEIKKEIRKEIKKRDKKKFVISFDDDSNSAQDKSTDIKILDLQDIMDDSQSFMYCYSNNGILRMIEFNKLLEYESKHHIMCTENTCCAGVFLRQEEYIHVDRLSGTYAPSEESFKIFKSILSQHFRSDNFKFHKDLNYLRDNASLKNHPDYIRSNSQQ